MTIGNLGALKQRDVKRMLAYSSIAHAGYLLVAFTAFAPGRHLSRRHFYTAAYSAMNVGAFAVSHRHLAATMSAPARSTTTPALALRRPFLAALSRLLPPLHDRHPLHRRLLRQVLRLLRGHRRRPLAGSPSSACSTPAWPAFITSASSSPSTAATPTPRAMTATASPNSHSPPQSPSPPPPWRHFTSESSPATSSTSPTAEP